MESKSKKTNKPGLKENTGTGEKGELIIETPSLNIELELIVVEEMGGAATLAVPLDVQVGWGSQWDEAAH